MKMSFLILNTIAGRKDLIFVEKSISGYKSSEKICKMPWIDFTNG